MVAYYSRGWCTLVLIICKFSSVAKTDKKKEKILEPFFIKLFPFFSQAGVVTRSEMKCYTPCTNHVSIPGMCCGSCEGKHHANQYGKKIRLWN
jgi:hypothetical protein